MCIFEETNKQKDMETLQKIQQVATKQEMYTINVAVRTVIDEYENQGFENWQPITEFMESEEVKLINDIQRRTYDEFGGAGMVMRDVIITTCGFIESLKR